LPLHLACKAYSQNLQLVRLLFDVHPEAILAQNEDEETPLDCVLAYGEENGEVVQFLEAQMAYARTAQDVRAMSWLPLHKALHDKATLGSIKLLVQANPSALRVIDNQGSLPLHIACESSSTDVVEYLLELDDTFLNHFDSGRNSPLHYACLGGNCRTVTYLLERNVPSVSEPNNDGKLPFHLLCETEGQVDRDSLEYVDTIWQLLLAHPQTVSQMLG